MANEPPRKPKPRRAKGEGSIVQRADGLWQFSLDLGKDAAGKRQRQHLYAKTRSDLQRKIADEKARGAGKIRTRSGDTIREWTESWLARDVEPNVARSTLAAWSLAWKKHAEPLVGSKRLDRFGPDDVVTVYDQLREKATGGRTIQLVAQTMRSSFDAAIRHGKFVGANPWRQVTVPRHDPKEARALAGQEARKFVAAARSDAFEALWLLSLLAGLRLGEAVGLEWSDVDLKTGSVNIRQQCTEVNGVARIEKLKTKSSRRIVDVGKIALEALRRRRAAATEEGHGSKYVFTTPSGTLVHRPNLRRRHFDDVCVRAGIGKLRIHDLRHSMTAHAIAAGVSPDVVARRLGHGSTRMTLDRYSHALPGQQREAAKAIESRLGLQPKPKPRRR